MHHKTADALREALAEIKRLRSDAAALPEAIAEIERLRSDADLHQKTSDALREALAEIERLRSDAELHRSKFDSGLSNLPTSSFWATGWFFKFLDPYNTKNKSK